MNKKQFSLIEVKESEGSRLREEFDSLEADRAAAKKRIAEFERTDTPTEPDPQIDNSRTGLIAQLAAARRALLVLDENCCLSLPDSNPEFTTPEYVEACQQVDLARQKESSSGSV